MVSQFPNLYGYNKRHFSFALRFCIGTLEPISGLVQLTKLALYDCRKLTGTLLLFGHNQRVISLADSRNTGSTGRLEPIENPASRRLRLPIGRSETEFVGVQHTAIFIRSPFPIGTLDPISGLVELKQLHLNMCQQLTGTFGCGETTREITDWSK